MLPIHRHAMHGRINELKKILQHTPENVNLQERDEGFTPLQIACQHGHTAVVAFLLEKEADIYAQNKLKDTALFITVFEAAKLENSSKLSDYIEIIELILKHEQQLRAKSPQKYAEIPLLINIAEKNGVTPLDWAKRKKNELLEKIIKKYQAPNQNDTSVETTLQNTEIEASSIATPLTSKSSTNNSTRQMLELFDTSSSSNPQRRTNISSDPSISPTSTPLEKTETESSQNSNQNIFIHLFKKILGSNDSASPEKRPLLKQKHH